METVGISGLASSENICSQLRLRRINGNRSLLFVTALAPGSQLRLRRINGNNFYCNESVTVSNVLSFG